MRVYKIETAVLDSEAGRDDNPFKLFDTDSMFFYGQYLRDAVGFFVSDFEYESVDCRRQ